MAGPALKLEMDLNVIGKIVKLISPESMKAAHEAGMQRAATELARIARDEYSNSPDMRTPGTMQVYAQGKSAGHTPERHTYPGAEPLRRVSASAQLAKAVQVTKLRAARGPASFMVGIDPGARQVGGDPADAGKSLAYIAKQLENPQPLVMPLTGRMLAYLQLLASERAGQPSKGPRADADRVYGVVVVNMRSRGVWRKTAERAKTELSSSYIKAFGQKFRVS